MLYCIRKSRNINCNSQSWDTLHSQSVKQQLEGSDMRTNISARTHSVTTHTHVKDLVVLAMFVAIILIMAFTPVGLIDLPLIKATILHVPVIIGAILMGPKKGAFLGFLFGLTSLIKNTMAPSLLSFAFTPAVPVPGLGTGSPWALFICFVPRILVGVTPWLVYALFRKLSAHNVGVKAGSLALCGAVGAFTNTALVMGSIYVIFRDAYAAANGIEAREVLGVILGIVTANGIPEAVVAAVLTPVICLALMKAHILEPKAVGKAVPAA